MEELVSVRPCSIVIVSYHNNLLMQACIESIRKTVPQSAYELVVVDNASTDGICEWLDRQEDIILVKNTENKGFGYACNQGVKVSAADNDIFFLNNDTMVMPNAVFWMRMGLYDSAKNGAAGCMSNFVSNGQVISEQFDKMEDYYTFSLRTNIPEEKALEQKFWLSGFAMLIARPVLDVTGLFDLRYGNGYYEDNDLGIRIQLAGYRTVLCHNSFIFHYGSKSFGVEESEQLMRINREVFKQKWGFDIDYYTFARRELIAFLGEDHKASIRVLEVGCGCGSTLAHIQYLYPNATVKGVELSEMPARIGSNSLDIIQGNIETLELPYEEGFFDYIIFGDVLEHLFAPEKVLRRMKEYLAPGGTILCSIPNLMHASVIIPLLNGVFEYRDAGILDRTHIRFFTLQSVYRMFEQAGYQIEMVAGTRAEEEIIARNGEFFEGLNHLLDKECADLLYIFQFLVKAKAQ
jgi:GT2 family glycosyltransferase